MEVKDMIYFIYKSVSLPNIGGAIPQVDGITTGLGKYKDFYAGSCEDANLLRLVTEFNPIIINKSILNGMCLIGLTEVRGVDETTGERTTRPLNDQELIDQTAAVAFFNKLNARNMIDVQVFDTKDSIADNAKMISLLFNMISKIYDALPTDIKDTISDTEKDMIEYTLSKFNAIQTRADVQLSTEGNALIDKLMNRQELVETVLTSAPTIG